ncbi:unnamed protein product [Amoebophrya sp. A25]|nr:unnamed protein product [Amoebophrya sp. A25]|eukprot:GSA25T00015842001.1
MPGPRSGYNLHFTRGLLARIFCLVWLLALSAVAKKGECAGSLYLCDSSAELKPDCSSCGDHSVADQNTKKCIKREVFSADYAIHDTVALLIWFFGAGLAMAAGVGGGGIFVPLGILLLRFGAKTATGLSQASIFGAACGGLVINLQNRHPIADRPLIDLDMALFLAPMEMAGAVLGVLVQQVLPDHTVILIMALILSNTAYLTFQKALKQRQKEKDGRASTGGLGGGNSEQLSSSNKERAELGDVVLITTTAPSQSTETPPPAVSEESTNQDHAVEHKLKPAEAGEWLLVQQGQEGGVTSALDASHSGPSTFSLAAEGEHRSSPSNSPSRNTDDGDDDKDVEALETRLTEMEASSPKCIRRNSRTSTVYSSMEWLEKSAAQPKKQYAYLAGLWLFLLTMLLLRGGKGVESMLRDLVPVCGVGYWILTLISFMGLFTFGLVMARRAVHKSIRKQAVSFPFVEGDVIWTWTDAFFYARWTFAAGVIAGLIGIGGGMILGPLMLQMGILPQVSTATTATLIMLTASSAAFMYVTSGLVPVSYAVLFFLAAFAGALLGKSRIDRYVKERNMTSLLIFILAAIISFATVMIAVAGLIKYADQNFCLEGLQPMCAK